MLAVVGKITVCFSLTSCADIVAVGRSISQVISVKIGGVYRDRQCESLENQARSSCVSFFCYFNALNAHWTSAGFLRLEKIFLYVLCYYFVCSTLDEVCVRLAGSCQRCVTFMTARM